MYYVSIREDIATGFCSPAEELVRISPLDVNHGIDVSAAAVVFFMERLILF